MTPHKGVQKTPFLAPPKNGHFRGARFFAQKMQNEGRNGSVLGPKNGPKKRPKTWPRATNTLIKMSASTFWDLFGVHILPIIGHIKYMPKTSIFHNFVDPPKMLKNSKNNISYILLSCLLLINYHKYSYLTILSLLKY